jgi:hypothetical protein
MERNPNYGDDSTQDVATFDHPRGMVSDNGDPERLSPDDETIADISNPGPPGSAWSLDKKNNTSRHDGGNNGSIMIRHRNSSGTHGHKGIWKWSKKDNITRHHGIISDDNVGGGEGINMIRHGKNVTSHYHGITNGQKKDITVHHGMEGDRRSKMHRKKGGNKGHHRIKNWQTKNNITVHQNSTLSLQEAHENFWTKRIIGKPKTPNKPKKKAKHG